MATDGDRSGNVVTFALASPQSPFVIDAQNRLVTNRSFDHEVEPTVQAVVVATDSAEVPRQVAVTVTVTVIELNDNTPVFPAVPYAIQ